MRFSIIVPIYNTEQYLDACIQSVLGQSVCDWEMILVDDGSTDRSGAIADAYAAADGRIRVLHRQNEGQLFARRAGSMDARGEYILCPDSDDFLEPDCLSVLQEVICTHSPDLLLFLGKTVGHPYKAEHTIGALKEKEGFLDKRFVYREILSSHKLNSMALKAFKRALLLHDTTDYSAFFGRAYGEDKVQTLHLFTEAQTVFYIPKVLYHYRYNPHGVSNSAESLSIQAMIAENMFAALYSYMQRWDMQDAESLQALETYYLRHLISVFYNRRKRCATKEERQRLRQYPWRRAISSHFPSGTRQNTLGAKERYKLFLIRYFGWAL